MDKPLIEELYHFGYNVIRYDPIGYPKRKYKIPQERGRLPSMKEVEIPGLGKRLVRFGDTGNCKKWHNCFTCPFPVEDCKGGSP